VQSTVEGTVARAKLFRGGGVWVCLVGVDPKWTSGVPLLLRQDRVSIGVYGQLRYKV
jgi:hypothetical protein